MKRDFLHKEHTLVLLFLCCLLFVMGGCSRRMYSHNRHAPVNKRNYRPADCGCGKKPRRPHRRRYSALDKEHPSPWQLEALPREETWEERENNL